MEPLSTPRTISRIAATLLLGAVALAAPGCGGSFGGGTDELDPTSGDFIFPTAAPVVRDRTRHTTTTLDNNDVLIIGGNSPTAGGVVAQAERYQPSQGGIFVVTGDLGTPRQGHAATRLFDDTVLVTGGEAAGGVVVASPELYDRHTGLFTAVPGSPHTARTNHRASFMRDGSVLLTGGDQGGAPLASIERYVGGATGFTSVGNLAQARSLHTAVALANGDVLVLGGFTDAAQSVPTASVEVLDRTTGLPRPAKKNLAQPRFGAGAAIFADGLIMLVGGFGVGGVALDTAEVYDPHDEEPVAALIMTRVRGSARASSLFDGRILVTGDDNTADLYDPFQGIFLRAADSLTFARANGHTLTPLSSAEVLIFGGANGAAELFDPRL